MGWAAKQFLRLGYKYQRIQFRMWICERLSEARGQRTDF